MAALPECAAHTSGGPCKYPPTAFSSDGSSYIHSTVTQGTSI
jgi:hypothetical protein